MLIVCPACASEYTIDPERLGAEGRTVRCASCRTQWFATPDSGAVRPPDEPAALFDAPLPEDEPKDEPAPAEPRLAETDPGEAGAAEPGAAEPETLSVDARNGRATDDAGAEPKPARRGRGPKRPARGKRPKGGLATKFGGKPAWIAAGLAGLALLAGVVAGRTAVVRALPETARLYAAVGLTVNLRGLDLRTVKSELAWSGPQPLLVIEGEIVNPTGAPVAVPDLQFAIRDSGGQPLYTWTNDAPRKTLAAGEAAWFRARLASPPPEGRQVLVRFAAAAAGPAVAAKDH